MNSKLVADPSAVLHQPPPIFQKISSTQAFILLGPILLLLYWWTLSHCNLPYTAFTIALQILLHLRGRNTLITVCGWLPNLFLTKHNMSFTSKLGEICVVTGSENLCGTEMLPLSAKLETLTVSALTLFSWMWKERGIGVIWHDLGAFMTVRAREFRICWRRDSWDLGSL